MIETGRMRSHVLIRIDGLHENVGQASQNFLCEGMVARLLLDINNFGMESFGCAGHGVLSLVIAVVRAGSR